MLLTKTSSHQITLNRMPNFTAEEHADGGVAKATAVTDASTQSENTSKESVIDTYRQVVDILCKALGTDTAEHERACLKLQQFGDFVADGIQRGFSNETRDQFLNQAQQNFAQFGTLVQQQNLPRDARQGAILSLAQGIDVCAPGMAQHIENAARELQALTDMAPNFMHRLTIAIEDQIQNFMQKHQICKHQGNEIHYVAAFFNQVADHFGLSLRTDALMPRDLAQTVLDAGARDVLAAGPVERVITQMAQDYLARIADFYAANQHNVHAESLDLLTVDAMHKKFERELKPTLDSLFGPVDNGIFFHTSSTSESERYWLTSDTTLVARAIARNLREAHVVGFKPAYVLGAPGDGLKLKQLGDSLFYVSETRKPAPVDPTDLPEPQTSSQPASNDKPRNLHQYQTLDRFVLEDMERGRQLLDQLDQASQAARDDFWRKMPASLYREMKDAPDLKESVEIFQKTLSLLDSNQARNRFALELLEQARLGGPPEVRQVIFDQLDVKQIAADSKNCHALLTFALKNDNAEFAMQLIAEMSPAMLGHQDEDGYTALMHALENEQTEVTLLLIQKMSPEQLNLQEVDGNTALMGALITQQAMPAMAIIRKLSEQQLNVQNASGYTALMFALVYGQTEAAEALIDILDRRQLRVKNSDDETALDIANKNDQYRDTATAQVLKDKMHWLKSRFYRSGQQAQRL